MGIRQLAPYYPVMVFLWIMRLFFMTRPDQKSRLSKASSMNCPNHPALRIFWATAGTHRTSWWMTLLKRDLKRLAHCVPIASSFPTKSGSRPNNLHPVSARMIRMSASWQLVNGTTMYTGIRAKWITATMLLFCWAIRRNSLVMPNLFVYSSLPKQIFQHRRFFPSMWTDGALRSSSETASRSLPLTSATFARKRGLRECGSFSHLYTFYAAPLWDTLGNLMKGSITSEIVYYRQLSFKMPFHCNRVILCIFRDLLIYSY